MAAVLPLAPLTSPTVARRPARRRAILPAVLAGSFVVAALLMSSLGLLLILDLSATGGLVAVAGLLAMVGLLVGSLPLLARAGMRH